VISLSFLFSIAILIVHITSHCNLNLANRQVLDPARGVLLVVGFCYYGGLMWDLCGLMWDLCGLCMGGFGLGSVLMGFCYCRGR
jgi:hypothetical protein